MSEITIIQKPTLISKEANDFVDKIEVVMVNDMVDSGEYEVIECPLKHIFMYAREITMPAGSRVTSKIHLTEHYFEVSKGKVTVRNFVGNEYFDIIISSPFRGVTHPGTRRILLVHNESECVWTTFHQIIEGETLPQIEERIIEKHENLLLNEIT